mmetsp:Transcript_28109/g.29304  ORF Transcript_28109/g.29304 Transcript_28109/m.29304 type:complete len:544 (-) Transcript_28109:53-1684(-)
MIKTPMNNIPLNDERAQKADDCLNASNINKNINQKSQEPVNEKDYVTASMKGMIEDLLESFYQRKVADHIIKASKEADFYIETPLPVACKAKDKKNNHIDNISTSSSPNTKIKFFKVLQQHSKNLCGFHSLFNIIHYIDYYKENIRYTELLNESTKPVNLNKQYHTFLADSHTKRINHLNQLSNLVHYWQFHKQCVSEILKSHLHLEEHCKESLLNLGPLERYMCKYLIEHNKEVNKRFTDHKADKQLSKLLYLDYEFIFFAFEHFQDSNKSKIKQMQQVIDGFRLSKQPYNILVLVLGITNHWSVLILEKNYNDGYQVKFNYMDSKQIEELFTLNLDSTRIETFINEREAHKKEYKIPAANKWQLNLFQQWFQDLNMIINIVRDLLTGKVILERLILEDYLENVIESFEGLFGVKLGEALSSLSISMKTEETVKKLFPVIEESTMSSVVNWLFNCYHPKFLTNDVLEAVNISQQLKSCYTEIKYLKEFRLMAQCFKYLVNSKKGQDLLYGKEGLHEKLPDRKIPRLIDWVLYMVEKSEKYFE